MNHVILHLCPVAKLSEEALAEELDNLVQLTPVDLQILIS